MLRRVLGLTAAVVTCAAATTLGVGPAAAMTQDQQVAYDACPLAAHRGDHSRHTENSIGAMQAAVSDRANFLEMDVQTTKDGVLVLMHDETIDRTTNGSGTVAAKSYRQLRAVKLNDGSRVPSLHQVLSLAQSSRVKVFVELKHIPPRYWARFHRRLVDFGLNRVVVDGFRSADNHALPSFHAAYPDVPVAPATDFPMKVSAIAAYGAVMIDYRIIRPAWLADMNAHGFPVYAWTMDDSTSWKKYTGRIDAVITNKPKAYVAYRDRVCASAGS